MGNKFLLGLFFATVFFGHGQTNGTKRLRGRVEATGKDVVGVVVQNSTLQNAVVTDIEGVFSIKVRPNDTLVFSAVHFKRKVLPVGSALYNSSFVTVPMEEFVNELEEVVVRPFDLSGNLNQDLGGLRLEKDVSATKLGLPNANVKIITQSERMLQEASGLGFQAGSGIGGAVTLNPIINAITGRTKMLKNRVKVDNTYARTQRVEDFYADTLFTTVLKIPSGKIDDFMYFCEVDQGFQTLVDTNDKLRIWDFMVTKSRTYRQNNNLD